MFFFSDIKCSVRLDNVCLFSAKNISDVVFVTDGGAFATGCGFM